MELNEVESGRTGLETEIRDVWADDYAQHNAGNVHYALAIRVCPSMQMFYQLADYNEPACFMAGSLRRCYWFLETSTIS